MLTPKQRSELKSMANHLQPTVIVGKGDISDGVIKSIENSLSSHELIKIRLLESALPRDEAASIITKRTNSDLVAIIGRIIILYKENPKNKKITLK